MSWRLLMWHTVLIVLHATAATVALVAGAWAMPSGRFFGVYQWSQIAMLVTLLGALVVGWPGYPLGIQVAYGGLVALGVAMLTRAELARRVLPRHTGGPTGSYLEHLGFTLIALTVGFVIIAVLRTGGPLAVGVVAGVVVILVGRRMVRTAKERLVGVRPRSEPDAGVRR